MFGSLDRLISTDSQLVSLEERHVSRFRFDERHQSAFVFPFQMMTYCMFFFILMGFYFALFQGNSSVSAIVIWMQCIFAPFYIPGLYHYYQYLSRDQHTEVELDSRHSLIKYSNPARKENLLFHTSQIEACHVHCSVLFPYRIDRMSLRLAGGRNIHISGLVASPMDILSRFDLPYQVERRWFNAAPRDWQKEPKMTKA